MIYWNYKYQLIFFFWKKKEIYFTLNGKNCLTFYNDLQKINNYRISQNSNNSNLQLTIGEEIKIKDIILSYVFENIDKTIFNKNNKIEFILQKYNSELKLTKSFNTLNELEQKLDIKEKEFKIKNCYNNVIHYFKSLLNSNVVNLDEFGKNNFLY